MRGKFTVLLCAIIVAFIVIAIYILMHTPKEQHKMSYLALGDSYTIGYKVRYNANYPNQIAAALRIEGIDVANPGIVAYPGWTTVDLERGLAQADIKDTFSFVTLLIGNNDIFQGWTTETYTANFERLLVRAIALAGGHANKVFVLSIPDISVTQFARERDSTKIATMIKAYNDANKVVTLRYHCGYIDITDALRAYANDASYYLEDWVHPTEKGYAVWAGIVAPAIAAQCSIK